MACDCEFKLPVVSGPVYILHHAGDLAMLLRAALPDTKVDDDSTIHTENGPVAWPWKPCKWRVVRLDGETMEAECLAKPHECITPDGCASCSLR